MGEFEHVVYMLKCKDDTLYTGYTNNLEKRLRMHESGKGAKYTRGRGPFQVELVETFETKEEAMKREYAIKKLPRHDKEQLIRRYRKEG
ncbi:GIY-YIG nuclease family protein [Virgibacillus sp. FSP13]